MDTEQEPLCEKNPIASPLPAEPANQPSEQEGAEQSETAECSNSREVQPEVSSTGPQKAAAEYAYLKRGWSSELHKLSIKNIPRCVRYGQVKKLLRKLGVSGHKLTVSVPCAFVTFLNEDLLADAEKRLAGYTWKGNLLQVNRAKPKPDPIMKRREEEERKAKQALKDGAKVPKLQVDEAQSVDELRKSIIPYFDMDYDAQIRMKSGKLRGYLRDFERKCNSAGCVNIADQGRDSWMRFEFVRSPVVFGYRNKCELSVGVCALSNQDLSLGFRVGKLSRNETRVLKLSDCAFHVPQPVVQFVDTVLQPAFYNLNSQSDIRFDTFNPMDRSGHLKTVIYRYSQFQNRAVFFIELNLEDHNAEQTRLRIDRLRSCVENELQKERPADIKESTDETSGSITVDAAVKTDATETAAFTFELYVIRNDSGTQIPYDKEHLELLVSSDKATLENDQPGCLIEAIGDLRFRVAPASFFQVNSAGARVLYDTIADSLRNSLSDLHRALLLDVCCGTGTIGLYLARYVQSVVGIELCESAVRDALHNRLLNKHLIAHGDEQDSRKTPSKCLFVCRKAEDAIGDVLRGDFASFQDALDPMQCAVDFATVGRPVVAVLDPPRAGVHWTVISAVRKHRAINCVLYVSCNVAAAMNNFVDLVRPESRRVKGAPFRLVSITPIDLFPLTEHFELLLVFKRDVQENATAASSTDE